MKKKITLALAGIVAIAAMSFTILSSNGKAGYTGSPSENNCTNCHSGTVNSGGGSVTIAASPSLTNGYVPGTVYTMTVTVAQTSCVLFGVDVEALFASGANGGTLAITNATLTQLKTKTVGANVRNNVVHTGNNNVGPNTQAFSFSWTAPATGSGIVTFYTSGMAADNDGSTSGDKTYTSSLAVPENTVGISEVSANSNFAIYPNPVKEKLNVNYSVASDSKVQVNVYSLDGKKVASLGEKNQSAGSYSEQFNVKNILTKGIYVVELKINDKSSLEKIVVE
jgi:hypothetical protein